MLHYQRAFAPTPTPDLRCPEKGHGLTFSQSSSVSFRPGRGLEGAGGPDSLALDGKNLRHNCGTIVRVLRNNCSAVAQQRPVRLCIFRYGLRYFRPDVQDKKRMIYYFAYTSLNCISGFALDTSARQSNEKFFTLFLAFALA